MGLSNYNTLLRRNIQFKHSTKGHNNLYFTLCSNRWEFNKSKIKKNKGVGNTGSRIWSECILLRLFELHTILKEEVFWRPYFCFLLNRFLYCQKIQKKQDSIKKRISSCNANRKSTINFSSLSCKRVVIRNEWQQKETQEQNQIRIWKSSKTF